jgi:hypothetical protein
MEKEMLKAIIHDFNPTQLRLCLLAVVAWVQMSPALTLEDIETIIEEARGK